MNMSNIDRIRKWLRRSFPGLYDRYGRYFHTRYPLRRRILRHARRHPEQYADPELAAAMEAVRDDGLSVFSFPGCKSYDTVPVDIRVDEEGFPWVDHGGKRLCFRRGSDPAKVASSYRALLREQDAASPHCYRTEGFEVEEGDVLLDVGSAEGIFALDNIERASHVVLFETDPSWIGALERTFGAWKDKVTIINKFASDVDGADTVTVDTVLRDGGLGGPVFLKLDVEGAEERVLNGAREALSHPGTRAVVCTYHCHGDHERLSEAMRARGYDVRTSAGWMLFIYDKKLQPPFFRRGVIYCKK